MNTRWLMSVLWMVAVSVGVWGEQDPLIGTWELNPAKSKGTPPPSAQKETLTYEQYGDNGVKAISHGLDSEGNPTYTEYVAYYDGKEYPVTKKSEESDTIVMKRIDAYTTERIFKKDGKVTRIATRTVSKDGKTLTMTDRRTNAKGQVIDTVRIFERVSQP